MSAFELAAPRLLVIETQPKRGQQVGAQRAVSFQGPSVSPPPAKRLLRQLRFLACLGGFIRLALFAGNSLAVSAPTLKSEPLFSDYPATQIEHPRVFQQVGLQSTTALTRRYRTLLRQEFKKPANFADHLRVVTWGCGSDCENFAILDLYTGVAYTLPQVEEISGVIGNTDARIEFRENSRMQIVSGSINDSAVQGKFYYLWTGRRLKLIGSTPLTFEPIQPP
jgi:hypothetical protein